MSHKLREKMTQIIAGIGESTIVVPILLNRMIAMSEHRLLKEKGRNILTPITYNIGSEFRAPFLFSNSI